MSKSLFIQNTQALFEVDQKLAFALRSLAKCEKFHLNEAKNIFCENELVGDEADLLAHLQEDKSKFYKYPVLFFYGFGNGALYQSLLENSYHKRLIVFEKELEILYLAFHCFDFAEALKSERLILFFTPSLDKAQLSTLFTYKDIQASIKTYNFRVYGKFYEKHCEESIANIHLLILESIKFTALAKGNDPKDSLIGIEHTLKNLPLLLERGIFQGFLKQRRAKRKTAIVVSTGPSLIKQLPLLKQYAKKASIFCADSAYPILQKHNIKPDYVLSLERVDFTSEFFREDFKEFDKDILFIIAALTHENTLKYLRQNDRTFMLVFRPLPSSALLGLDDFGYLGVGHSVANMAYELAVALRHEHIIIIGQDLAFNKEGHSHPEEHLYGKDDESYRNEGTKTTAYGGVGEVKTSLTWNLFRHNFERDIAFAKTTLKTISYNCTEGGARIAGTVEEPFKSVCERLLQNEPDKVKFDEAPHLSAKEAKKAFKKTQQKLENALKRTQHFFKLVKAELARLEKLLPQDYKFEKLDFAELEKSKEKFLRFFKDIKKNVFFTELLDVLYFHNECELVRLESLMSESELEEKALLVQWLISQAHWFMEFSEYVYRQDEVILRCIKEWKAYL